MKLEISNMPGGRSQDPRYGQLSGHMPKSLIKTFKVTVAGMETTLSEALEQSVMLWLEKVENGDNLPAIEERLDQRRTSSASEEKEEGANK